MDCLIFPTTSHCCFNGPVILCSFIIIVTTTTVVYAIVFSGGGRRICIRGDETRCKLMLGFGVTAGLLLFFGLVIKVFNHYQRKKNEESTIEMMAQRTDNAIAILDNNNATSPDHQLINMNSNDDNRPLQSQTRPQIRENQLPPPPYNAWPSPPNY